MRVNVKTVIRNFNLLNLLLIVCGLLFGYLMVMPMFDVNVTMTQPQVKQAVTEVTENAESQEGATAESVVPEGPKSPVVSPFDYTIIAEQNLFHPERKIPVEKKDEKPLPKPDFVLYGTLVTDEVQYAYMEDKKATRTTPGRGKRQTALKVGDVMSGFVLKEVDPEQVVMVRGEETVVVKVIDPSITKERVGEAPVTAQAQQGQQRQPAAQVQQGQQRQPGAPTRPVRASRRASPVPQAAPPQQ